MSPVPIVCLTYRRTRLAPMAGYSWVMEVARQALNGVRYVRPGAGHEVHQRPDHRSVFTIVDLGGSVPMACCHPKAGEYLVSVRLLRQGRMTSPLVA
ncbi:hypothetical protein AeNC1_017650 [Aphanomyces euteiches]|nr:hypothetical protein AeNC1_017650 [Aphanomyces euteiches]